MPRTIRGELRGDGLRVAVLVARWHKDVTDRLLAGALAVLEKAGVGKDAILVVEVPGAFELPQAAAVLASQGGIDAVVALGCVVKGETDHDRYIAQAVAHGLTDVATRHGLPVGFGVITANDYAQALARSEGAGGAGKKGGHKGMEAAEAVVRLADALRRREARP